MIKAIDFFDNPEELAIGATFGVAPLFITGWLAPLAAIACAILWRMGGVKGGNKWFRRLGVPFFISLEILLATNAWISILPFLLMWAPLAMGYGIPDLTDEGSKLGAFFYKLTGKNERAANFYTRLVIGFICALSIAPMIAVAPLGASLTIVIIALGFPTITLLV